jgi:hypothetical protein
LWGLGFDRSS